MSLSHIALSQADDIGQLTVSIDRSRQTVGTVLHELIANTDMNVAYEESTLDMQRTVKLSYTKKLDITEVMDAIADATGTDYQIVGKQILILKKEKTSRTVNPTKYTLSGQVSDAQTGEDLIGATIRIVGQTLGVVTNVYGFYSLTLPEGTYQVSCSFVGFQEQVVTIDLSSNQTQKFELSENEEVLEEVVVLARRDEDINVTSTEMGADEVSIDVAKKLPALFGEVDIIKTIQLLPGVKVVGEGGSGFYVRGGNVDQNLVLLDEAPIYNASHLLGFFSAFNPEAVKDMKLYKGAIPAQYGGRLSSVLDIRMKDGNSKRWTAAGGIGTMMTRLGVEGPITPKGSIMVAGRRSYLDTFAKMSNWVQGKEVNSSQQFYFYDLNAKANYRINDNNRLFASGYFGRDVIATDIGSDMNINVDWGNSTAMMRWNHLFSPKLFSNLTYYYSNYDYALNFSEEVSQFLWDSDLQEHSIKLDFGAYLNPNNTLKFGVQTIQHAIAPGNIETYEADGTKESHNLQKNKSYESAAYISNEQVVSKKIKLDYGLRLSNFQNVGPQEVYTLDENYEISDTVQHNKGAYNSYWNLEPRVAARYQINSSSSFKASYNRTSQYIQLASNGNFSSPFDIWFSSTEQIKPQLADQFSIGYFKNFKQNTYEASIEVYYKDLQNSIDFKDHAELLFNENLEGELRVGDAKAYGVEFLLRKNVGKLTGWIGYTLSKAEKKIPTINEGNWYNAKFDKPHDLSIVGVYDITPYISIGGSFVYSTGGAVTFPTGRYYYGGAAVPVYSERNGERLPDYHRLDASVTLKSKKNDNRRFQSEWVFSVYNLYNRKNAFTISFKQEADNPTVTYAEKSAIFGIIPSLTYNVRF
ncbi:TonB-dependent receptor [Reichenbachiella sp. MSK19-1]|uniref:TonB-dependent receptor n=1 Tax=Reichenbachiella sp. MSK19-1 TaxID=1897631 RepID=UPI002100A615|nr:TonB-dependent receptor [Reichenbachiella sp. MSK19-1]